MGIESGSPALQVNSLLSHQEFEGGNSAKFYSISMLYVLN